MLYLTFFLAFVAAQRASNVSNIILGGGRPPVSLDQCNSACQNYNQVLFSTCAAQKSVFAKQMECACDTVFLRSTTLCTSCCKALGYDYSQLTLVLQSCQKMMKSHPKPSKTRYSTTSTVASSYTPYYAEPTSTSTYYAEPTEEPYVVPLPTITHPPNDPLPMSNMSIRLGRPLVMLALAILGCIIVL